MEKLLILGSGYVGQSLKKYDQNNFMIQTTSRKKSAEIQFNLEDRDTWSNIPFVDYTIWTFPAEPLELVETFSDQYGNRLGQIVVIGTTSSFLTTQEHQVVDESSILNSESTRLAGEKLIQSHGGVLVHSAGIYGPGRDPRDWVRRGLVGPAKNYVNFIHIEDLCQILFAACNSEFSGQSFIAADSHPQLWSDLIEDWKHRFQLETKQTSGSPRRNSKKINCTNSLNTLNVQLKFQTVTEGLIAIDKSPTKNSV